MRKQEPCDAGGRAQFGGWKGDHDQLPQRQADRDGGTTLRYRLETKPTQWSQAAGIVVGGSGEKRQPTIRPRSESISQCSSSFSLLLFR